MKGSRVYLLLGTFIVLFAGFNNKYPLFTGKTSECIEAGFSRAASTTECLVYGVFVAQTSWGYSLWLTALAQSFLLVLMVYLLIKSLVDQKRVLPLFLIGVFVSTFVLSASVMASSIDPGVFGCTAVMGVWVLLFAQTLSTRDAWIVGTLIVLGAAMNRAYQLVLLWVLGVLLLWFVGQAIKPLRFPMIIKGKRLLFCLIAIGLGVMPHYLLHQSVPTSTNDLTTHTPPVPPSITEYVGVQTALQAFDSTQVVQSINKHYSYEIREVFLTRQLGKWMEYAWHDRFNVVALLLCLLLTVYQLIKRFNAVQGWLFFYVLIVNILYVATSTSLDGAQPSRLFELAWLFILPPLLGLSINITKNKLLS